MPIPNATGNINFSKNSQGRYASSFFPDWRTLDQVSKYEWLTKFYDANNLYTDLANTAYWLDEFLEPLKGLFTPTHRSVEFFASKLCQGSPRITTNNQSIIEPLNQFLDWSNFDSQKMVAIRKDAMLGNLFKKIVVNGGKVYEEILEAEYVTSFSKDGRGFLLTFRMDIPDGNKWNTEYWTADPIDGQPYYASWSNRFGPSAKLDQLGTPDEFVYLSQWGIDFLPIVHIMFRDIGRQFGMAAVEHCIDKIHELNRQGTNLHGYLYNFNKPVYGVTDGRDSSGAPIPSKVTATEVEGVKFIKTNGQIADLVPKIQFDVALETLKHYEEQIERDLPELRYYALSDRELSGEALTKLLGGALDRASEAQKNFVNGQKKLNQMALTLGRNAGIFKFSGEFDSGQLEHTLDFDEILPSNSNKDKAEVLSKLPPEIPLPLRMKLAGYDQTIIDSVSNISTQPQA